ncbi:MAG: BspA family leucine-rich repeat surface protein, partial [Oscillospiraceae bacterium]|nr:BspA family leucine-rich repeat surface protein [Oscillospiraceae bacterium]
MFDNCPAKGVSIAYLDEEGVLTIGGYVNKEQVWAAVGKKDVDSAPTKKVTSVVAAEGTVLPEDCSSLFAEFGETESIDLSKANTANVTDMSSMFGGCSGLTSLDVSRFNTANVTDMYYMFIGCSDLTSLDVSNFDTSKVTDMTGMFSGCSGLTSLDVSNFDTSK